MRRKTFFKEMMLPAFWVFVFVVSSHGYESSKTETGAAAASSNISDLRKRSNYTKSQARYLWFYILPDVSGSRLIKQGI